MMIHCLDESFAQDLEDSEMQKRLARLEGGKTE